MTQTATPRTDSAASEPLERWVLDELPDGVLLMSAEGVIQATNRKFLEMIGRERELLLGQPIEAIVAEQDMLHLVGVEAMFQGPIQESNIIFATADGEHRHLLVCSARSSDQKHLVLTTRATGSAQKELADTTRWAAAEQERSQDLAQARDALAATNDALRGAQLEIETAYLKLQSEMQTRERLEKELRLAQKLEGIGQLAAGVAHEINTPMQYLGDNVAFLLRAFARLNEHLQAAEAALSPGGAATVEDARALLDSSKAQLKLKFVLDGVPKALRDSRSGIEHVSSIVRALKSFAHVDHDEKALGDINQALVDTLAVAQSEYKSVAVIETELGPLPPVPCFCGRLNQVFLNLIVNAAHAIEEAKRDGLGCIRITTSISEGVVTVAISDTGAGIPEHVRERVFDPFFTTKPVGKGTGQGLSLARSIVVETHGGLLSFETELGRGTTFTIRLPADGKSKLAASEA
jgi:PAS domain S-box-containing protein